MIFKIRIFNCKIIKLYFRELKKCIIIISYYNTKKILKNTYIQCFSENAFK